MKKLQRRDFLKNTSIADAAAMGGTLIGCGVKSNEGPAIQDGKTYEWRMVTTWPPHFPILGEYAEELARWIEVMSGGRMKIQVYGGGELEDLTVAPESASPGEWSLLLGR